MKRIVITILLLLISGTVLAETNFPTNQHVLTAPSTDYSIAFLSQIFGTVGNVLQGTSGQILGHMFKIFNQGIMIVAALWLSYTAATTILRNIFEHKPMHIFIFLRIAFGFALLIPSTATGYSLLQSVFMKIVVEGVGLADKTWASALHYMQYGGRLYIPPTNLSNDSSIITNALGSSASQMGPLAQIFQDETCMLESRTWENQKAQQTVQANGSQNSLPSLGYQLIFDESNNMIYFPGADNVGESNQVNASNASCGYVESQFAMAPPSGIPSTSPEYAKMKNIAFEAMKQAVVSMLPAAKNYVDNYQGTSNYTAENPKVVLTSILAYTNLITQYQFMLQKMGTSKFDFVDKAIDEGWIMAGGFYWRVEEVNDKSSVISVSNLFPRATAPLITSQGTFMQQAASAMNSYIPEVSADWQNYIGAQQNTVGSTNSSSDLAGGLSGNLYSSLTSSIFGLNRPNDFNPIASLMREGNILLTVIQTIWLAAIGLTVGLSVGAGICDAQNPGREILNVGLKWMKSIIMLLTTLLLVPGAIFAYYIPLYPFAVYTFSAIGWFALVIEGMAAAPLVCMGLTHPEGHDFLGTADKALMLFLSIFIRPALMVMGLIAAMIVSFVAFRLFIVAYGTLLGNLIHSGALDNPLLVVINICIVLVVFGVMTVEIIEQCYKLIYQLPNAILQWIGGPQTGQDFSGISKALQSGISQTAQGWGKSGEKTQDAADEYAKEKSKQVNKQNSGNIGGGT